MIDASHNAEDQRTDTESQIVSESQPGFPMLRSAADSISRFEAALAVVTDGVAAGAVRNVALQEAKSTLSGIVCVAWETHVAAPHFHGTVGPDELQDLYWSINLMGLHDVIATSKKVSKSGLEGPQIEAMRAFCTEVLPLAQAVASLKDKVIKGRAPTAAPPKPTNPNKVIRTCPVCFRQIAVQGMTMAHHGYQRPSYGWQTASCAGIRFKPLEQSSEGLKWLITTLQGRLSGLRSAIANQATEPEFLMVKSRARDKVEVIRRTDASWKKAFARHMAEVESEIPKLEHELPILERKLADWAPVEPLSPVELRG